jgi:hypothetical protein
MSKNTCVVCGNTTTLYGKAVVMKKHEGVFSQCESCQMIQVENPFWLPEAYKTAIVSYDTGYVARNLRCARKTKTLIELSSTKRSPCLDYGGGYGLFVRLMRDSGYDFKIFDQYCEPIFAREQKINKLSPSNSPYQIVTAFEVFEHLQNPLEVATDILSASEMLYITTTLLPEGRPALTEWAYFGPEHGQHIAFYTQKSLRHIASITGCYLYSDGNYQHILSKKNKSKTLTWLATRDKVSICVDLMIRRKALT